MAKRMGAKTVKVKASHVSRISHPDEITWAKPGSRAAGLAPIRLCQQAASRRRARIHSGE